jgi:hypothetical protein
MPARPRGRLKSGRADKARSAGWPGIGEKKSPAVASHPASQKLVESALPLYRLVPLTTESASHVNARHSPGALERVANSHSRARHKPKKFRHV